jgi:hypothetical protein
MPWHCAATVRSVTHVSAVTIMSRNHAPGGKLKFWVSRDFLIDFLLLSLDPPHVIDVKEQRLSGFFVSLLVGLSVTMGPILRTVPMAVLFGVFLYLGFCSMMGVQFFERLSLLFMPVKYHPTVPFVRRVPTYKMHLFTIIQILALILLWTVKSSRFSLAFPFFLILMVPIQKKMTQFYTTAEMQAVSTHTFEGGPLVEEEQVSSRGLLVWLDDKIKIKPRKSKKAELFKMAAKNGFWS